MIGIYRIYNRIAGLIYIGSSARNINQRFQEHKRDLKYNRHKNPRLQKAWDSYGSDSFIFEFIEILPEDSTKEFVLEREQYYIDQTNCLDPRYGYNIAVKAGSRLGSKHLPEGLAKIRARMNDPEVRAKISKGRRENPPVLTEEGRKRISEANLGNQRGLGYKHTEEARTAISQNNIGKHSNGELCRLGKHPWIETNIYTESNGSQECRPCRTERSKKWLDKGNRDEWNKRRRENRKAKKQTLVNTPAPC